MDKCIIHDSDKLTPNFHQTQTHQHKKTLQELKSNLFCYNFPWARIKKTQNLEPFTMETLIFQKNHLHEINFFLQTEYNKFTNNFYLSTHYWNRFL